MLFLASSMFFFLNFNSGNTLVRRYFREHLASFHPLLIIFFLGNILVAAYVILLMIKLSSNDSERVDRLDLPYRIVFSITLIAMGFYSFFTYPYVAVPLGVMTLGILSGFIMWATPKIIDNDNEVF